MSAVTGTDARHAASDSDELAVEANRARDRLFRAVDALERKGHDSLDVEKLVRDHFVIIGTATAVACIGAGIVVARAAYRYTHADKIRSAERIAMVRRLWRHPERAARRRGFVADAARSLALSALTWAITARARSALHRIAAPSRDAATPAPHARG